MEETLVEISGNLEAIKNILTVMAFLFVLKIFLN